MFPENIFPNPDGTNVDAIGIVSDASNVRTGDNPSYTLEDNFYVMYPQFKPGTDGNSVVPAAILQIFLNLANACIKEARWHDMWSMAMGFFIAHFATLWLQGTANSGSGAAGVLAAAQAKGLNISKSVGDVSAGYDYSSIANDLDGWAAWKLTIYGQQLATFGKLAGKGGIMVW